MISSLRFSLVLGIVATTTVVLLPFQLLAIGTRSRVSRWIPVLWHRITCRAIGLRISYTGSLDRTRPLLIVSNHVSWSDILVLGSMGPVTFIAKHEVASIPGASLLAKLQRTVFVIREKRHHSGHQAREITERLLAGEAVVLFAEGTTGDGNQLLNFKSALFGSAQYAVREREMPAVQIQPIAIRYTALHGIPLGRRGRARASWTGDEDLGPHLSQFVKSGHWDVKVNFGSSLPFVETSHRREFAGQTREIVRSLLAGEGTTREQ